MTSYRSNHRKKKSNTEDLDQSEACELYPHSDYYNSYTWPNFYKHRPCSIWAQTAVTVHLWQKIRKVINRSSKVREEAVFEWL